MRVRSKLADARLRPLCFALALTSTGGLTACSSTDDTQAAGDGAPPAVSDGGVSVATDATVPSDAAPADAGTIAHLDSATDADAAAADSAPLGPWPPSATYQNPFAWTDLPDLDIFRVDDTFYYSSSTMHFSPGAPVLRSYDLLHWEFAGHSVPTLDFGAKYDMNGSRAYTNGIWASFMNYRKSNQTFYWGGCVDFYQTHIFTAKAVEGPWTEHPAIGHCYYDAGLLIDDDDTMYVSFAAYDVPNGTTIHVAQLGPDGLSEAKSQLVYSSPGLALEGTRMYKYKGNYYIWTDNPPFTEYVLKSTQGPFGPYELRKILEVNGPIPGGGDPHQGGIVEDQNGNWWYMGFEDAYPVGRVPQLAPMTWGADGWPTINLVNGTWGQSYNYPNLPRPPRTVKPMTGIDSFNAATLGPEWEWNHNPDNSKWSLGNGKVTLQTATVTNDLYSARNTLTRRTFGPNSTATIVLEFGNMASGDRAGLALLRDASAWIGVKRDGNVTSLSMVNGITMNVGDWQHTANTGTEVATAALTGTKVWLRASLDGHPGNGAKGQFSYSTDGTTFVPLGNALATTNDWEFFMGYRFAIFNYATTALGGKVALDRFEVTVP